MRPNSKLKSTKRIQSLKDPASKTIGSGMVAGSKVVVGAQAINLAKTGNLKPMSEKLSLSALFANTFKSGYKATRLLHNKKYSCSSGETKCDFIYNKKNKSIGITKLSNENLFAPNLKNLIKVYDKLINFSKKIDCNFIECETWIFYQHPKLAKKLGFELVGNYNKFNNVIKKNKVSKIIGFDFENKNLICKNNNNKDIIIDLKKISLPLWRLNTK